MLLLAAQIFWVISQLVPMGLVVFSQYNDGQRGGKIKVRARVEQVDAKLLKITEVPFATTTSSLIDSIVRANEKGKIKIKKIRMINMKLI